MSDDNFEQIELNEREKEILAEELSKSSENSTGAFFANADIIQHNLESQYGEEIGNDRIDVICREIISPFYQGSKTPQYEDVKNILGDEYQVFLDDPKPVDFSPGYVAPSSDSNNESAKTSVGSESEPSSESFGDHEDSRKNGDGYPGNKEKSREEAKEKAEEKADKRENDAEKMRSEAREIRRQSAANAFKSPHALMGYSLAKLANIGSTVFKNVLTSGALGLSALSGKRFGYIGPRLPYNMGAKKHQNNWGNTDKRFLAGSEFINKIHKIDTSLDKNNPSKAQTEMNDLLSFLESKEAKNMKLTKEQKSRVKPVMNSIDKGLNKLGAGNDTDKSLADQMKKQMKESLEKVFQFIQKMFGMGPSTDKSAPSGP